MKKKYQLEIYIDLTKFFITKIIKFDDKTSYSNYFEYESSLFYSKNIMMLLTDRSEITY